MTKSAWLILNYLAAILQAFLPVVEALALSSLFKYAQVLGCPQESKRWLGARRRGAVSGLAMAKKPSPTPTLSEEELATMEERRLQVRFRTKFYYMVMLGCLCWWCVLGLRVDGLLRLQTTVQNNSAEYKQLCT